MKTAVLSVVYPGLSPFLKDFAASLKQQSDSQFELYIVNDGMTNVMNYFLDMPVKIRNVLPGLPIARIRKIGIQWLADENIDAVVFADADDCFARNRIAVCKDLLTMYDVVVNELVLFGSNAVKGSTMLQGRFQHGQLIKSGDLLCSNCCGLSNTASHLNSVASAMGDIPDEIQAFDWALFSRVLLAGKTAVFTDATQTYYRQHDNNMAAPHLLSDAQILRGVQIKRAHYLSLSNRNEWYYAQAQKFDEIYQKLHSDSNFYLEYTSIIRRKAIKNPLWWEMIRDLEDVEL